MASQVETLSFVARRLIQYERKFSQAPLDRRKAVSGLFNGITQSVNSLAEDLSRARLPHESCRKLVLHSTRLAELSEEELGHSEAERLATSLRSACDQEKLYLEYTSSERREYLSEELRKAAILIQALADGIYIEPKDGESDGSGLAAPA